MPKEFNNPLDDEMWEQLDIGDEPLLPDFAPVPTPSSKPGKASRSQAIHQVKHGTPDLAGRSMQGNYQYLTLLLPDDDAAQLRRLARVYSMKFRPFMRWVIDWCANHYENGARPSVAEKSNSGGQRTAVLVAPAMTEVLKSWAKQERMQFQPFVRWLIASFLNAYERDRMQPVEPEEYVQDEAELTHWASLSVQKFEGVGGASS